MKFGYFITQARAAVAFKVLVLKLKEGECLKDLSVLKCERKFPVTFVTSRHINNDIHTTTACSSIKKNSKLKFAWSQHM
jgi:hypothetical protein